MNPISVSSSWGTLPLVVGGKRPKRTAIDGRASRAVVILSLLAAASTEGCSAKGDKQTYDPVALGMMSTDTPFYDDGETEIFQVKRAISLPVRMPPQVILLRSPRQRSRRTLAHLGFRATTSKCRSRGRCRTSTRRPTTSRCCSTLGANSLAMCPVSTSAKSQRCPISRGSTSSSALTPSRDNRAFLPTTTWTSWPPISPPCRRSSADNPAATTPAMEADADYGAGVNGMINHALRAPQPLER